MCKYFNCINYIDFVTLAFNKRLPEDNANTSKLVGVLYDTDITDIRISCVCWCK